jgi:PKD repeat protein
MKKTLLLMVILSSFFFAQAQKSILFHGEKNEMQISNNSGLHFTASFNLHEINLEQINTPGGVFAQISAPEFTYRYNDGNPAIPVYSRLIEIPGQIETEIRVKSFTTTIIQLSDYGIYDKIVPAQPTWSKSTDPSDVEFIFNESAYITNDFTQGSLVAVEYQGMARGVGIAQLIIDPVRYNPVTNQLKIYNNIVFEVEYITNDYASYLEEKDRVYSPLFNSTYNRLDNYIPAGTRDVITQYPLTYVIVSDPMFKDSLQQFVLWKTQKGFNVIEAYTNNPAVGTTTTSIKAYLQGLYNAGTPTNPAPSYVLIVGDVAQVPSFAGTAGTHPSDMYFVEYTGGADYIPEVYIGRFSATNTAQLMPQIYKTLQYEKFTMPSSTYMDTVILVAGNDANFEMSHGNPHINYGTNNYFNSSNNIFAWAYLGPNNGDSQIGADMRSKLYKGFGLANYTAHCNSDRWGDPTFTSAQVPNMYNLDKYGLMIGNCCLSNKFNDASCIGETLLRIANKGAVGYIGGSNNTYWDEDYWWGVGTTSTPVPSNPTIATTGIGAYDGLFHSNSQPYSDWFTANAQIFYCGNTAVQNSTSTLKKYYWEIYHLMGDPSVMTYLWDPAPMALTYDSPLLVGDNTLLVQCEPYTLVAISRDSVLLDSKFSGPNNSVLLEFPALTSVGSALVVGTKQNRRPWIQEIEIEELSIPVDAQVMQIQNIQPQYTCINIDIAPQVLLRNKGINNLTQVTVNYSWNGGAIQQVSWAGNLVSLDTDVVSLPDYNISTGNHTLVVYTTNPNGTADGNTLNDTATFTFTAADLPVSADFATSAIEFCTPPAVVNFTNNSSNAASYLWDFGDGNTSTVINPNHTFTDVGLYTISLIADAGVCGSDQMVLNNLILVGAQPPIASDVSNCGPIVFHLSASAIGDVMWFSDAAASNLIHTGPNYTTPLLNNSTTYYLGTEISNTYFGGRTDNTGTGAYFTATTAHGLVFNCTSPTLLKTVKVYFGGTVAANRTIRLENSGGTLIQSVTVSVPPGESRITLNMNIPAGNGLRLMGPTSPNLYRNGATGMNIGYPLAAGNNISITQSTAGGAEPNYYYFFYDWEVEEHCESPLTELNAYIHSTPSANFTYSLNNNTATFTNTSAGGSGATYLWDFGDGNFSNLENPIHTYATNGSFNVNLEISNSCGMNDITQLVDITTSIGEINEGDGISMYPNPATDAIQITSLTTIEKIEIFDTAGKLISSYEPSSDIYTADISHLAAGVYMIRIHTNNESISKQLLVK